MSYFRFSVGCGEEWTRTTELRRGQIYSLLQLPLCDFPIFPDVLRLFPGAHRADEGTRTPDRLITNQLLYQLSYIGFFSFVKQLFVLLFWGCKNTTFFSSRKFFLPFSSNYFIYHWYSILFLFFKITPSVYFIFFFQLYLSCFGSFSYSAMRYCFLFLYFVLILNSLVYISNPELSSNNYRILLITSLLKRFSCMCVSVLSSR